jgi:hypothetical protein
MTWRCKDSRCELTVDARCVVKSTTISSSNATVALLRVKVLFWLADARTLDLPVPESEHHCVKESKRLRTLFAVTHCCCCSKDPPTQKHNDTTFTSRTRRFSAISKVSSKHT